MDNARYRRIVGFFFWLLAGLVWWELILPRLGMRGMVAQTRSQRLRTAARKYRQLAVQMGGVLIKVGQFLSTRVDVLPVDFTEELEGLQDEVSPEPFELIRQVVEEEFQSPLHSIFDRFEESPLASASIGQAHRAWVARPGNELSQSTELVQVVVKVQRKNIQKIITTDMAALRRVGRWIALYAPIRKRVNVQVLLADFEATLNQETDYILEGKHAEEFAQNFAERPRVRVPRVAWRFTTRRVITLEDVGAIKITDYAAIEAANIDLKQVAALIFETYMQQMFIDSFFHADPHPGNLFVAPGTENGPAGREFQLVYIDFGMMGRITPKQMLGLREIAIAITTQDAPRVLRAYQHLGFLMPNADLTLLEQAGTEVFERFWGKSTVELREIGFREVQRFSQEYKELLFQLPFQLPEELLLLGRAASILSGICVGLDPEFNVWQSILPYAQELMRAEQGEGWEFWKKELMQIQQQVIRLPGRLNNLLIRLESGELAFQNPHLDQRVERVERSLRRMNATLIFSVYLLGGIVLFALGQNVAGGALVAIAVLYGAWQSFFLP